jgi:nicotinate dehydrogenase subunit A
MALGITMIKKIVFSLNNKMVQVEADEQTPLLYILRNDFQLNGPKFGCGLGECGACSVLIDTRVARCCVIPLIAVEGREVQTLEGLGSIESPSFVQKAFIDEQASQCGYCTNGMIITTTAFLNKCAVKPSKEQIKEALRANLCRCGTHIEIIKAVEAAAENLFSDASNLLEEGK